jgi:hypothetical protein
MATKRKPKHITKEADLNDIINLTHEEAARKATIMNWFGTFADAPRFNTYDTVEIPAGKYGIDKHKNKKPFTTTVGLWVFNKAFIEPVSNVLGYINETVNGDKYDDINQTLSYALLEDKITVDQLKDFIMQTQILMGCASAICPSHDMDILLLTNQAEIKKKELEKKYADRIAQGDIVAMKAVEDELTAWAKQQLKDSESADMYNSGARSSWGNNFKNMYLMRGPLKGTDGNYTYTSSSYMSGMKKDEYSAVNDSAVGGPYSRSRKTQMGGYLEKQFTNATQHIKVLPAGSDCGSTGTITITLTNKNLSMWLYSFIVGNNGSLTELTMENKDKYIGKTVKFRYSGLCKSKNGCICEKCAGTMYRRIGIENIGLGTMIMMSSLKNASMKRFHSNTLNLAELSPDECFGTL